MVLLTVGVFLGGRWCAVLYASLIGLAIVDEWWVNFFKYDRNRPESKLFYSLYFLGLGSVLLVDSMLPNKIFIVIGALFHLFLSGVVLYTRGGSPLIFLDKIRQRFPYVAVLYTLCPVVALITLTRFENWERLLGALLVVNFSMDIGAWFFGVKWGKTPLIPQISPKKSLEGLLGGLFAASLMGVLYWLNFVGPRGFVLIPVFTLLGLSSQLGDFVESLFKRHFGIKDSSSLIPGHGGVYDRVDGLLFLAPFFAIVVIILMRPFPS